MNALVRLVTLSGLALCAMCGDPNQPCADVPGVAAVDIGIGNPNAPSSYLAIQPMQVVHLSPGSQGGQHIWLQLEARGICPDHPRVQIHVVRVSDGAVIGTSQYTGTAWTPAPGALAGTYLSPPYRGVIDPDQYCTIVNGGEVRVEATVDDTAMRIAQSSVAVTVSGWSADTLEQDRVSREMCCADYNNRVCWPNGPPADASVDGGADASADVADHDVLDGSVDGTDATDGADASMPEG